MRGLSDRIEKNLTIEAVVRSELCLGCGTCVALCPNNAIVLRIRTKKKVYMAEIVGSCEECGLCYRVCPGKGVPLLRMGGKLFSTSMQSSVGRYIACYSGYAVDQNERFHSSSGGFVTAILKELLQKKEIDGAIVTRFNPERLEAYAVIAKSEEEIGKCRGSKYCPVPVNIILRRVLAERNKNKYVFVGLPCHIQGLRLAQDVMPILRKKIILALGLFCGGMLGLEATRQVLRHRHITPKQVSKLSFRGSGWPGAMKIETVDTRTYSLSYPEYFKGLGYLEPNRCRLCIDPLAELADIGFGDAWLPRYANDSDGYSIVIIRGLEGESIFQQTIKSMRIIAEQISMEDVLKSQNGNIVIKRATMGVRRVRYAILFKKLPTYDLKFHLSLKAVYKDLRMYLGQLIKMWSNELRSYFNDRVSKKGK
ncbi:Coenzyme F420 hydrogenase/dehydrogenase, beta subunit C-terminal domain [candidate division WOR-3 bacterium]|nr:Coenzyme F420 hydrogenase/dehydrogenase, beta subunit C-terminal domain [candidate division WOR-3 bacterium]